MDMDMVKNIQVIKTPSIKLGPIWIYSELNMHITGEKHINVD